MKLTAPVAAPDPVEDEEEEKPAHLAAADDDLGDEEPARATKEDKPRAEKAVVKMAGDILEAVANLVESGRRWAAERDRQRNMVDAIYFVNAPHAKPKAKRYRSVRLAIQLLSAQVGCYAGDWTPATREEALAAITAARDGLRGPKLVEKGKKASR
jgi:hypothetical protein